MPGGVPVVFDVLAKPFRLPWRCPVCRSLRGSFQGEVPYIPQKNQLLQATTHKDIAFKSLCSGAL